MSDPRSSSKGYRNFALLPLDVGLNRHINLCPISEIYKILPSNACSKFYHNKVFYPNTGLYS